MFVSCAYLRLVVVVTLGFRHYIQVGQQCVNEKYTNINPVLRVKDRSKEPHKEIFKIHLVLVKVWYFCI